MGSPTIFNGRRTKTLTADGLLLQSGAALDNDGSRNYIANGHAESVTAPWATYNDGGLSGPRPISGTGGTAFLTWTRSTTTPLRGQGEFVLTKDASNQQGQGVSYTFTIDRADLAKPLDIRFDYELISGTFAGSIAPATDSDVIVYLYDVTNAVLIEPAGRLLEPIVAGQTYRYKGTFQTAPNSQTYRLILHVATVSTQAYTLGFDNFYVGPQVFSNGAVVTDWQEYTPTVTVDSGSVPTFSTRVGEWRRVGDSIEVVATAIWSAAATFSGFRFSLPAGLSMDTAKIATTNAFEVGIAYLRDAGTANYPAIVRRITTSTTDFEVLYTGVNTSDAGVTQDPTFAFSITQAAPFTWGSGDQIHATFKVPITGWSSNVQMSNDTDTRVVSFLGIPTSTALTAGVTNLPATIIKDSHGAWTGSTYVVPVSGDYLISAFVYSATAGFTLVSYIDGVGSRYIGNSSNANEGASGSLIIPNLRAGQVISLRSTASLTTASDGGQSISIQRISGPAQIAASEFVNARASGDPASATSGNPIIWPTIDWSTHGAYNSSTGLFTVPLAGKYRVSGFVNSANATIALNIAKNGTTDVTGGITDANGEGFFSGVSRCVAGDTLSLEPNGTLDVTSGYIYFEKIADY